MNAMSNWRRASTLAMVTSVTAILAACTTTHQRHCFVGSEITIPTTDSTPPTVAIDFHMPDGSIISRTSGDGLPNQITVPTNGEVTIIALTKDAQGVKDSQIWAADIRCSGTSTVSCSGPGLLGAPTANNAEANSAGDMGCAERIASQKVIVSKTTTPTRSESVSQEVHAEGLNFGGQTERTNPYRLSR